MWSVCVGLFFNEPHHQTFPGVSSHLAPTSSVLFPYFYHNQRSVYPVVLASHVKTCHGWVTDCIFPGVPHLPWLVLHLKSRRLFFLTPPRIECNFCPLNWSKLWIADVVLPCPQRISWKAQLQLKLQVQPCHLKRAPLQQSASSVAFTFTKWHKGVCCLNARLEYVKEVLSKAFKDIQLN